MNDFKRELREKTKLESAAILRKAHSEIFDKNRTCKTSLENLSYALIKKVREENKDIGKEPGE